MDDGHFSIKTEVIFIMAIIFSISRHKESSYITNREVFSFFSYFFENFYKKNIIKTGELKYEYKTLSFYFNHSIV